MEDFKAAHYIAENPGRIFPEYQTLSALKTTAIRAALTANLGLKPGSEGLSLSLRLLELSASVGQIELDSPRLDVAEILRRRGVEPALNLYLDWCRFEAIDQMKREEVSQYFDSIWYPGSDDLTLFDDSLRWVLHVLHYGELRMTHLQ